MFKPWAIAAISLSLLATAASAAEDPQTGHWVLDLKRSKYVTATLPKMSEATLTPLGPDGVSLKVNMITAKGEEAHIMYSGQYDGKPNPRTETGAGAISGQTVTLKRVGPRAVQRVVYLKGKNVGEEVWSISADGKTRTVVQSGTDAKGKKIDNLQIYVKQ